MANAPTPGNDPVTNPQPVDGDTALPGMDLSVDDMAAALKAKADAAEVAIERKLAEIKVLKADVIILRVERDKAKRLFAATQPRAPRAAR